MMTPDDRKLGQLTAADLEDLIRRALASVTRQVAVTPKRERLLAPRDVAEVLNVSINTARSIMREQGALRIGNQLRWTGTKLDRYLRRAGVTVGAESLLHHDRTQPEAKSLDSLETKSSEADLFRHPIRPSTARKGSRESESVPPANPAERAKGFTRSH